MVLLSEVESQKSLESQVATRIHSRKGYINWIYHEMLSGSNYYWTQFYVISNCLAVLRGNRVIMKEWRIVKDDIRYNTINHKIFKPCQNQ